MSKSCLRRSREQKSGFYNSVQIIQMLHTSINAQLMNGCFFFFDFSLIKLFGETSRITSF